jgi:hypothetical protein
MTGQLRRDVKKLESRIDYGGLAKEAAGWKVPRGVGIRSDRGY